MLKELQEKLPAEVSKQTRTNLPARLRMAATYAVAQSMNGRVANTCNLSEDWGIFHPIWGMQPEISALSPI